MRFVGMVAAGLVWASAAFAISFPSLSGRVVDAANILPKATQQAITKQLATHEAATSNQIVVVTVPSLGGETIEEYGYQLGRHWGIGRKDKNNGALLIVAPNDRQMRIEVGYGLEGVMTDAMSSSIIQSVILPEFRKGNMAEGVVAGVQAMLSVLSGEEVAALNEASSSDGDIPTWLKVPLGILMFGVAGYFMLAGLLAALMVPALVLDAVGFGALWRTLKSVGKRLRLHRLLLLFLASSSWRSGGGSGGSSGGGSSGGGFSGGGGSFGGGGSSGRW